MKYAKSISALVTGVIGWGYLVVDSPSAPITAREWVALSVAAATALGVYAYPNKPEAPNPRQP
jgi:hypothetical protein